MSVLSSEQIEAAERDGYVLVRGIQTPEQCEADIQRIQMYAEGAVVPPPDMLVQREPRVARGELTTSGADLRKITRICHHDALFRGLATDPTIVGAMQQLMGPDLKLFRGDVLMKPPLVGSAKGMHQDSPYWPIEPMALWSCWMPFDPATEENGCMTAIPASHKLGPLSHVSVTDDYVVPREHYDARAVVSVPMEPGDGLLFHSLLLHETSENRSESSRRAITMSYMSAGYTYTGPTPKPDYMRISGGDVPGGV